MQPDKKADNEVKLRLIQEIIATATCTCQPTNFSRWNPDETKCLTCQIEDALTNPQHSA